MVLDLVVYKITQNIEEINITKTILNHYLFAQILRVKTSQNPVIVIL